MKGNEQVQTFNVQLRKYDTKNRSYLKKKRKEGTYYSSYWNKRILKRVFDCWWCFYNSPTIFVYFVLNSL